MKSETTTTPQPPDPRKHIKDGDSFDYIVVGAGTAGSVVANRLTEDPNISVLLIEAGSDPPMESNLPGLVNYLLNTSSDWNHKSQVDNEEFQCHQNHQIHLAHGKLLGGTSSINHMFYVRGNPNDYNTWASMVNDESWNYTNVLPLFKKSETLKYDAILNSSNAKFHGTEGNIIVTKKTSSNSKFYLESLKELGYDILLDTNGDKTMGFNEQLLIVADGIRQSTANAFLSGIKDRPNLYVLKESLVTKIVIDNDKIARGVKLKNNIGTITVKAKKEIVVSAGAINSAQLLMLSGIGPKSKLQNLNQTVLVDLSVGENLQSHRLVYLMLKHTKTYHEFTPFNPHEYMASAVAGFVALNKSQSYPDYEVIMLGTNGEGIVSFCSDTFFMKNELCQHFYEESKGKDVIWVTLNNFDKKSRGQVSLKSLNPEDPPSVHLNPFPDKDDLEKYVSYIEDFTRILNTTSFKKLGAEVVKLPICNDFVDGSLDYWKCYLQCVGSSSFHFASTCAMGPMESGGVVDSQLRVHGIHKLRVADASVMPTVPSGNTMIPTVMIGEKAAEINKKDNL